MIEIPSSETDVIEESNREYEASEKKPEKIWVTIQ